MKFSYKIKYSGVFMVVFLIILLILPGISASTASQSEDPSNLQPFLDTVSVFKNDLVVENTDELDSEFNLNSEEKVKLNFESKLIGKDEGMKFEEFKRATEVFARDDWELATSGDNYEKIDDLVESNDILVVDPMKNVKDDKLSEVSTDEFETRDYTEEGFELEGSRRVLTLNLEPEGAEESKELDSEEDMIKNKMMQMINKIKKLKTEVISKNSEIDIIFNEVAQMRTVVNKMENVSYKTLLKELENLLKDLNLLRKGSIYTAYADNILGNITVMEAFHGLYVIYRTPFVLLRHNSRMYAKFEKYLYNLFKNEFPNLVKSLLERFLKSFKNLMSYAYGNTLKFTRVAYIHHSVTKKTLMIYDTLLSDYIKFKFEADVTSVNCKSNNKFVLRVAEVLTKCKFVKHYKYIRHSVFNNSTIVSSFLKRNYSLGMDSNTDLMYVKYKDYKMLEVLYQIYSLKLLKLCQRLALQSLRCTALALNLFVRDKEDSVNRYTRPLFNLREDSAFKFNNMYLLLRNTSIYTLQKVDVFMDYCFNYANKLNPELSILVPKDLSNRIFFVSVMILVTFMLIFTAQLLLQGVFTILVSPFTARSKTSVNSRFRHWYHRSHVRQLVHVIKKNFSSHGRSHKKKHKYHRNFESFHRIIDDGNVTNSDNYRQFKSNKSS